MWRYRPTGDLGRRTGAQLGALMILGGEILAIPTFLSTPMRHGVAAFTVVMLVLRPVIAFAAVALPWERWDRRWLLVWPVWTILSVTAASTISFAHGAPALGGLFVTAFFLVGMTQRRGTSLWLLPVAMPCWVATYGGWQHQLIGRMPLAVGAWVMIAETLASLVHHMQALTDGLAKEAATDPLTGLGNRRDLPHDLASLRPGDSVVVIDLDDFKALNDRYGHGAGDKVLADLGDTIRGVLRTNDTGIRLGGEEVLLLLPDAHEVGAREVLARLSSQWAKVQPGVTFSAGVCVVGDVSPAAAVAAADAALYRAKSDGRNCWRFASTSTDADLRELADGGLAPESTFSR